MDEVTHHVVRGAKLITKVKKNMKKRMLSAFEKFFLYQRSIIETLIDQLKSICHIEHQGIAVL